MKIDKVIISSDLNPKFLNFWPLASRSWIKVFNIRPTLVTVSRNKEDLALRKRLEVWGDVFFIESRSSAPMANQAKLARWYYASKCLDEIVMLEDIDTVFFSNRYLSEKITFLRTDEMLGIGNEVNKEDPSYLGKFPVSNIVGKGSLFAAMFATDEKVEFTDFIESFKGINVFDDKEDPFQSPHNFSDESLVRALRKKNHFSNINVIQRDVDIRTEWMDRSWWPNRPSDVSKYILANLPRPLYENRRKAKPVIEYFFPGQKYPWITRRRSSIWNEDGRLQMIIVRILHSIKCRFKKHLGFRS
ncbi:hypothetical protein MCEMKE157_01339 [actinobacterium SCGC AAA044-D11]